MDVVGTQLKLTCVGDGYIGKTCMLWSYVYRKFPKDYVPTVFETHAVKTTVNGEQYTLSLYDTAGQEDWETLRIMAYPDTDVIVLCFSVVRPDSMENVKSKWIPELNKHLLNTPIVLVGTQCDLRNINTNNSNSIQTNGNGVSAGATVNRSNANKTYITTKEGEELKAKIKAFKYIECSALTQENINEVFETCISAYEQSKTPNRPTIFSRIFACFGLNRGYDSLKKRDDKSDKYTVKYKK